MGMMSILDPMGDTEIKWDDPETEARARELFEDLRRKNYLAFEGKSGEHIRGFTPDTDHMVMVPPVQGG